MKPAPHHRADFGGWIADTRSLTLEERGLYADLKVLIGERGGVLPLPRDDDFCRLLSTDPRRLRRVLGRLVMLGKIEIRGEILMLGTSVGLPADIGPTSPRSRADLRGTSAGLPRDPDPGNKRNQPHEQNGRTPIAHPLSTSFGETRKKDPVADATGGWTVDPAGGRQPADVIWGPALDWLAEAEGRAKEPLRSMVGRWCKAHGETLTLAVLVDCRQQSPPIVGPVAWCEAALQFRNRKHGKQRSYGRERRDGATSTFMAAAQQGTGTGHD